MQAGSITFSTALDNEQLEKDLNALTKKIEKKEREIAELTAKRDEAKGKLDTFDSSELETEKKKLEEMKAAREKYAEISKKIISAEEREKKITADIAQKENERAAAHQQRLETLDRLSVAEGRLGDLEEAPIKDRDKIREQKEEIRILARDMGKLDDAVQKYDAEIKRSTESLKEQKALFSQLAHQIDPAAPSKERVDAQSKKVRSLQSEWDQAKNSVDKYDKAIAESSQKLDDLKTEAGILTQKIDKSNKSQGLFKKSAEATEKAMDRLKGRILGLAASAMVFNVISRALTSLQQLTMKYIKTNDEARQAIAQMKGALLTLAQPLIEVIIPAFTLFVNILTKIITVVAQLVSSLFGKTVKQSQDGAKALHKEANAIGAVGEAAEEAAGSLAGFDEINSINTENAKGAGGGVSAGDEIAPDFSWMDGMDSGFLDRLKEIADLVGLIGAGFALWKIGTMLPGVLGQIASILGGILMTVGGLLTFWNGLTDAWENGVDWLNLIEMIGGLAAAAFGLYTIFEALHPGWGKIAAGIALVAGGLTMLVTGFHDAMENGWNLQNTLLSIAGIFATGLGIALITGSWIPLLVAGIASVLLALTIATGHGEELLNGIRSVIEGFKDFFVGIFTGDMEKAVGGIEKIFAGLKISIGAVIDGVKDTLLSFLGWLDEKTGGKFHGIIEVAKGFVTTFFDDVKSIAGEWIEDIKQIFQGIIQFISGVFTQDWDMALEGLQNIWKGAWNSIISVLEGAINLIIKGLNWLISQMNKISFDVPSWVPEVGGKSIGINIPSIPEAKIPRLARGAVIPPNREFMAVLGDQRSGNNLEAPEDLIRKIVREESGGGNAELFQMLQSILAAIKDGHVIMVDGAVFGRTAIRTINGITTSSGKQQLKL